MNLIPLPKKIEIKQRFLSNKTLKVASKISDERLINTIRKLPLSDNGTDFEINFETGNKESYEINIEIEKIVINANSAAGAFYAIQTLRQLFKNKKVPCCKIYDEPDFEYRGFYHDITRGKVPKVDTIKRLIDDMAYYKLNSLQLYVEHTFEFKEYADSIERTGYLTADEIKEIDRYCRLNFIEFIPSLSTFGHLFELLKKDKYRHLQEVQDYKGKEFFWEDRMIHHTIDPTKEESFELIKSLIDQYMVNFSSDKFNICCDETFDLKNGKHKDEDTGKLYIDFVNRIIRYLKSKNKKVMMWADILLNYPEQIENVPNDVELLNWFYWKEPDENTFKIIRDAKREQIVCPGTSTWNRLCEDFETEIINIIKMTDLGFKYSAKGVLNTNWGDWGNPCSIELAMFGLVLGAAKSWNISTVVDNEYIESVNDILYENDNACSYIKRISDISCCIGWRDLAKCYANMLCGRMYDIEFPEEEKIREKVSECFEIISDIEKDVWKNNRYKKQMMLAAEGLAVMAELLANHAGYRIERKTCTEKWLEKYSKSWLEDNKQSELSEIIKMFSYVEKQTIKGGVL